MERKSKKGIIIALMLVIIAAIIIVSLLFVMKNKNQKENEEVSKNQAPQEVIIEDEEEEEKESTDIEIVPTMNDTVYSDTAWCPTFQLVWNDMVNEVVKKDVEFINDEEPEYLDNLNAQLFKEEDISDDLYFKTYGIKSDDLKDEILKGIKEKFNETSDIIHEDDNWGSGEDGHYIFYTMLKRNFNFINEFDILDNGDFGDKYENVEYFGIDEETENSDVIKDQVDVLYYNSDDDFAISINTKEGDEVILTKGSDGENFDSIYNSVNEKSESFDGNTSMQDEDKLKVPNLNINLLKEYDELKDKYFYNSENEECRIDEAIQTIQLELNNKGGKIKSEAVIGMDVAAASGPSNTPKPRNFYLDDNFVMFVKEGDKDLPYFALKVSDISKYQENVKEK